MRERAASEWVSEDSVSEWMNEWINEWVSESQSEQINKLLISSLSNKTCKSKITLVIQMEVKKCCKLRQAIRENCVISWGDCVKKEIGNGQTKPRPCLKVKNNWYLLTGKKKLWLDFQQLVIKITLAWWDVLLQSVAQG